MKIFDINKHIRVVCEAGKTRNGFKHTATLMYDGLEQESVKINYLNRTWERYEYQSVLYRLAEKSNTLTADERALLRHYAENHDERDDGLHATAMVMALGDLFGQDQKGSNDWKTRMMRAGLEGRGLIMPDDWDELDEDTKTARLNAVIEGLK